MLISLRIRHYLLFLYLILIILCLIVYLDLFSFHIVKGLEISVSGWLELLHGWRDILLILLIDGFLSKKNQYILLGYEPTFRLVIIDISDISEFLLGKYLNRSEFKLLWNDNKDREDYDFNNHFLRIIIVYMFITLLSTKGFCSIV